MKTKDIVYIALFAALTAVLGLLPKFPLPGIAPITAQSLAPMLAGSILGAKRGGLAILLFVVLVAIGLPLLPGGRGGFSTLIGPWSGYIWGWVAGAFITGLLVERHWQNYNYLSAVLCNIAGGILVVYLFGTLGFALVNQSSFLAALSSAIAYLPGDIIKVFIASTIALKVKQSYPLINR